MSRDKDLLDLGFEPIESSDESQELSALGFEPIVTDIEGDKPSQTDALLRGLAQGATADWADEIIGGVEVAGSTVFGEDKLADIVENYRKYRDESREATKQAREAHPGTFTTGQVGGGIATALIPGTAIAKAPSLLGKIASGAKFGAAYGALGGAGASEAEIEQPLDLATDIGTGALTGATVGGVLPLAGATASRAATGTKELAGKLAAANPIKLGYKAGKEGIVASKEGITKEGMKFAKEVHSTMYDNLTKNGVAKNEALKLADDIGTKINAGKEIREIYNELVEQGVVSSSAQSEVQPVVKVLKEVIEGVDPAAKNLQKLQKQAEKSILKKSQESTSKEAQAVIKAEKNLAKKQEMGNLDIEGNVDELQKVVGDIGETVGEGGLLLGKQATFKPIDGKPFTVKSLSDATPYKPKVDLKVTKDGTPIINVQDMGSGKITSFVGDAVEEPLVAIKKLNIEQLSPSDTEILIKEVNRHTDHPVAGSYMKRLAGQIRKLSNEALEEFDTTGANRQIALTTKSAEKLGIKDRLAKDGFGADDQRDTVLKKMLSSETVDKTRAFDYMKEAGGDLAKLGERGPFVDDLMKTARLVDEPLQSTSLMGTIYGSGKALLMKGGNVAGRVSRKAQPVLDQVNNILALPKAKLADIGSKMSLSDNKGIQKFGEELNFISQQTDAVKNTLLWALTQQSSFRHAVKQVDREVFGIGDEQFVEPPMNPPSEPTESVMIPFRPEEEEEEDLESFDEVNEVQSSGRSPQGKMDSVLDTDKMREWEGFKTSGYVPNNSGKVIGNSGVTVANGLDLGQRNNLDDLNIPEDLKLKLTPYLGVKREQALDLINNQPLELTNEEANVLADATDEAYYKQAESKFNINKYGKKFSDLPKEVRTVLNSVNFHTGSIGSKTIEKAANDDDYSDLIDELENYYSNPQIQEGFQGQRRKKEADYLRKNIMSPQGKNAEQEMQEILNKATIQQQQLGSGADPMKLTGPKESLMASIAASNVDPTTKQELEDKAFYGDIKGLQDLLMKYRSTIS